jgi:tripartite-type tricarboxylate transporter receptor subunit TctC
MRRDMKMRRDMLKMLTGAGLALAGAAVAAPARASAGAWPDRPLRLVVPYAPGGTTDIVARQYAEFLRARIRQTVIVENRPGAATNIGTEAVVRAAPDGYTLLVGTTLLASNPAYGPTPGFDPITALQPISLLTVIPFLIAANPRFPARNAAEVIALARREPGRHTISSAQLDFQVALLAHRSGIELEHVGYRGGAPAMTDAISGQVSMVLALVPVLLPAVRDGSLAPIAVTGAERSPVLPGVGTMRESGQSTAEAVSWYGIYAPAGTPRPIIDRLSEETRAFTRDPEIAAGLTAMGVDPRGSTPEELDRRLRELTNDYHALVRELRAGTAAEQRR